jgi:monofunctional glycosyltransferase
MAKQDSAGMQAGSGPGARRTAPGGRTGAAGKWRRPAGPGRRGQGGIGRRGLRAVGWIALVTVTALLTAVVALQLWYLAQIVWLKYDDPDSTRFMREQQAALRLKDPIARISHQWVPYDRISPNLKRAVIAAEDANFNDHDGVDWAAIERAFERNRERGRVTHGGSTITMQLAKNLFLSGERSYLRKAQEVVLAYMLDAVLGKRRILEIYLNVAEWGVGVFGCEAGARRHFDTGCSDLQPAEAARMAAMLPRPRHFDRNPWAPALARRAALIERWMAGVEVP